MDSLSPLPSRWKVSILGLAPSRDTRPPKVWRVDVGCPLVGWLVGWLVLLDTPRDAPSNVSSQIIATSHDRFTPFLVV